MRRAVRLRERGFSLMELMVVLAILSLALAVSAPQIARLVENAAFREHVDSVAWEIEALRVRAFLAGVDLVFDPLRPEEGPLQSARDLAGEGWRFTGAPIHARAVGFCAGGPIVLTNPAGRQATLTFATPTCARG